MVANANVNALMKITREQVMVTLNGQMAVFQNQIEEIELHANKALENKDTNLYCMLVREQSKIGLMHIELDKQLDLHKEIYGEQHDRDKLERAYIRGLECGLIIFGADNQKVTTSNKWADS